MTPQRKAALQFIHDRGEVQHFIFESKRSATPTRRMFRLMQHAHQIERGLNGWTLTDKGRRNLHDE